MPVYKTVITAALALSLAVPALTQVVVIEQPPVAGTLAKQQDVLLAKIYAVQTQEAAGR